ncbi:hypothetical protein [Sulfitobacter donghicola]|uniref:Gamma-glutamyl kinase n=1 Tax=Sulfitobacter donghicola DSW-25 = KCTC 12864 = JCM 14565 TaxID=1300350 RepID=A0A073IRN5_9RHOB|nr:hypothetical protein [Sulfitobacter donghicola]KEJ88027.1 hypothetical protein DSW25_17285 [Sulfitobacter donghicola DSW-25 = KCTC 12864 = JCM 14565]KIN68762.1 hypothetical protein Z948_2493 [Sulfitobacter donghicola DSW-25 = KCTC 12864 = JCM 14565]
MLVFSAQNLVLFSVPKTGSTAMEVALKPWADIAFYKQRKHTPVGRYQRKIAPFLREAYQLEPETMAVMRAPIEHLRSWYRYRAATLEVDFDGFVQAVLSASPPEWAKIGSQLNFLTGPTGALGIDHLFAYESQPVLRNWLSARMGADITFRPMNVSPPAPTPISDETEALFNSRYAKEIALYQQVTAAGGHLARAA